ncbi:acyloxyacyl hydrolase [Cupriavidus sp. CuC1]|uniref:acyloxyacyl hydrolase n=1 Tax=Cupriavidus sp. CuC1 TaxID=3373131 RepID=UPI0037D59F8D
MLRSVFSFVLISSAFASAAALAAPAGEDASWFEPVRLGAALGAGGEASIARMEARWNLKNDLWATSSQSIRVRLGLEASVGGWNPHGSNSNLMGDVGFTPIFRVQGAGRSGPFAEIGAGVHLLSRTRISDAKVFSTAFQFGDRIAAGYRFGDAIDSELAVRFQHYSNAGIKEPNPGINFYMLQYSARF